MEGREKGKSPFKIQCANAAAAAVTREMRSGEQGVTTMRGMVGLKEGRKCGDPWDVIVLFQHLIQNGRQCKRCKRGQNLT